MTVVRRLHILVLTLALIIELPSSAGAGAVFGQGGPSGPVAKFAAGADGEILDEVREVREVRRVRWVLNLPELRAGRPGLRLTDRIDTRLRYEPGSLELCRV